MSRLRIASIVEGDGEVLALPILLRRIWSELLGGEHVEVLRPNRCKRDRLVNASYNELARFVELAVQQLSAKRDATPELILILVDAEDDLACESGPALLKRSQDCRPDLEMTCVIANHCYETWFAAAAVSLIACGRLRSDASVVGDPENADLRKSWVKQHINRAKYSETADQQDSPQRWIWLSVEKNRPPSTNFVASWKPVCTPPRRMKVRPDQIDSAKRNVIPC